MTPEDVLTAVAASFDHPRNLLVDPTGQPISTRNLEDEQSTGSVSGIRTPFNTEIITGLTPEQLTVVIQRANQGEHGDFLRMCAELERRDGHYFSVLNIRRRAILGLDSAVLPPRGASTDDPVTRAVQELIDSSAFQQQILHIMDALGKGFSVNEIIWDFSDDIWKPVQYKFRPAHWFIFDPDTLSELRLDNGTSEGEVLHLNKYIIHCPTIFSGIPLAGGLGRIVACLHLFKSFALKDWMVFAEVFGMPLRIGKYGPKATAKDKENLKRAVTAIGSDAAAIIAATMSIEFERVNASGHAGSDMFFQNLADWCDGQVSKAVVGQTMTTEDGSSLGQAAVHNDVRLDIKFSDAIELNATVNGQLIRPFVDLNFPGERRGEFDYPRWSYDTTVPADLVQWAKAVAPFIDRNLRVPTEQVRKRLKLRAPRDNEEVLVPINLVAALAESGSSSVDTETTGSEESS